MKLLEAEQKSLQKAWAILLSAFFPEKNLAPLDPGLDYWSVITDIVTTLVRHQQSLCDVVGPLTFMDRGLRTPTACSLLFRWLMLAHYVTRVPLWIPQGLPELQYLVRAWAPVCAELAPANDNVTEQSAPAKVVRFPVKVSVDPLYRSRFVREVQGAEAYAVFRGAVLEDEEKRAALTAALNSGKDVPSGVVAASLEASRQREAARSAWLEKLSELPTPFSINLALSLALGTDPPEPVLDRALVAWENMRTRGAP